MLVLFVGIGADQLRPAPKFTGKAIPDPPRQKEPWTPPDTRLPRFLVRATAALFEAGMADPRGCAYHEIEISDIGFLVKTRGFVLPERPGDSGRFAVGWDGVLRPALSVGAAADLEADVRTVAESLRKAKQEPVAQHMQFGHAGGFVLWHPFTRTAFHVSGSAAVEARSPLKVCLLLRLGRADLAETLFSAGTVWTPDTPRPDLTDYHITFLSLAAEWAGIEYHRLIPAHQRGEDGVALDVARRLTSFRKAVDARAEAMGSLRPEPRSGQSAPASYLGELPELPALLADQERRAAEPPRGPIPGRGGDPAARIAALIRDFDQIQASQGMNPDSPPVVREVIAEGDAAVEPLLTALVSDTRLTRSVLESFNAMAPDHIRPVTDFVYWALRGILKTDHFLDNSGDFDALRTPEGRRRLAGVIRTDWEKNRAVPLIERWYRTLRDDHAGTERWMEAAAGIVQPADREGPPTFAAINLQGRRPGKAPAMKGEPLRSRRDPSVSDLFARRAAQIARSGPLGSSPDFNLIGACDFALAFALWDEPAALPTLRSLMTTCRDRSLADPKNLRNESWYGRPIARITLARARAGDRAALEEYAAWVRSIGPGAVRNTWHDALEPMWVYADHPALVSAARAMFLDPKSPWLPLVPRTRDPVAFHFQDLVESPLVCLAPFREALLAALGDTAEVGTAQRSEKGGVVFRMESGLSGSAGDMRTPDADVRTGVEVPIRACDVVAWKLSALEGAPECQLNWPEARRDAAVAACGEYLRKYGPHLSPEPLPGPPDFPHPRAHLRFSLLDHPATAEDVREGRAVFSLEDEGEVRVVALPAGLPAPARWVTLKKFPIDRSFANGTTRREYLQDGWVWQVEEVRRGDRWERFYGFAGHATIARAPASEIELPADRFRSSPLPGGLEAQLRLADPPKAGSGPGSGFVYPPGRPIVVTLGLRNRLGVDRTAPTEFVRRADDGKPALRRGIELVLTRTGRAGFGPGGNPNPPALSPTRAARFDPGDASRTLAPTESFEALSIDLKDWFAGLGPGSYVFHLDFADDSGLGAGRSNEVYFTVGAPDARPR